MNLLNQHPEGVTAIAQGIALCQGMNVEKEALKGRKQINQR
jgi:hypothetical protein